MQFIPEKAIEGVLDKFEKKGFFDQLSKALIDEQPFVLSYIESESFDILIEEEKDLLWYCSLVIYGACNSIVENMPEIHQEILNKWEEKNYESIEDHVKFSEMADTFFEKYAQEDLLAFVEDTLIPDEEDELTPVGRKVLFITLKTLIDSLEESIQA
jgi:hypothetical protein